MVQKGFRFGMLLQFAIGPVCLFILKTAAQRGFAAALPGVVAAALADAAELLLALWGVGAILQKSPRAKKILAAGGSFVIFFFGLAFVLGAFHLSVLPAISLPGPASGAVFESTLLLVLANPLSIVFWGGVFSARVASQHLVKKDLAFFAAGCILSTLVFLTGVSLLGSLAGQFLPPVFIAVLNAGVGAAMVALALQGLYRAFHPKAAPPPYPRLFWAGGPC
ncbi:MAG: LysE family translocator [Oscillospiraceae bacterium]